MAEGDLSCAAGSERREYLIRALSDRAEIRDRLQPQLEYTAYALGQLEPGLFERARWFLAQGPSGQGLVTHSRGGLGDASFVVGDPLAIAAILSIEPGPTQSYVTCQPQHLDALKRVYQLANRQPMMRMSVRAERFRPRTGIPAVRLHGVDIRRINALYGSDGSPTYYSPEHVDGGGYRGVMVGGRLVAIAGTHVVSPQERVAVVGNVFTHPSYRGYGYATAATSATTEALFERCETVVLTVDPMNVPAVAAYERLGYRESGRLVEASATRRDPAGLVAFLRRIRAKVRGRSRGGALVSVRA